MTGFRGGHGFADGVLTLARAQLGQRMGQRLAIGADRRVERGLEDRGGARTIPLACRDQHRGERGRKALAVQPQRDRGAPARLLDMAVEQLDYCDRALRLAEIVVERQRLLEPGAAGGAAGRMGGGNERSRPFRTCFS